MVIDFHTHSFPDELADRAVGRLAQSGGIHNCHIYPEVNEKGGK